MSRQEHEDELYGYHTYLSDLIAIEQENIFQGEKEECYIVWMPYSWLILIVKNNMMQE